MNRYYRRVCVVRLAALWWISVAFGLSVLFEPIAGEIEDARALGLYAEGVPVEMVRELSVILRAGKPINSIAFASNGGYVVLYGRNEFIAKDIPATLRQKLESFRDAGYGLKRVSIGPDDPWFVLSDRQWSARAESEFVDALTKLDADKEEVGDAVLGPSSYYIVRGANGLVARNVPEKMLERGRELSRESTTVRCVALSQGGYWCIVNGRNGFAGQMPDAMAEALNSLHAKESALGPIAFSPSNGWVVIGSSATAGLAASEPARSPQSRTLSGTMPSQANVQSALNRINEIFVQTSAGGFFRHQHLSLKNGEFLYWSVWRGGKDQTKVYASDLDLATLSLNNDSNPSELRIQCKNRETRVRQTVVSEKSEGFGNNASLVFDHVETKPNGSVLAIRFTSDSRLESELTAAVRQLISYAQLDERATIPEVRTSFFDKLDAANGLEQKLSDNFSRWARLQAEWNDLIENWRKYLPDVLDRRQEERYEKKKERVGDQLGDANREGDRLRTEYKRLWDQTW